MGNPIENLGDYNRARIDLQAKNGDLDALYKDVGDTAVAKAAPGLILKGSIIGSAVTILVGGIAFLGYKGIHFIRDRKQKLRNEPALKKKFVETMSESSNIDTEEATDSKI